MVKLKFKIKKNMNKLLSKYYNKKYSEKLYESNFHKKINWENPIEFNEKLMCLKVQNYNRSTIVSRCSDKYDEYLFKLSRGIKEKHLQKIVKVYNNANEIKKTDLPNKFVIKCTHGYGFYIICENLNNFDLKTAKRKLNKWLKTKFGYETGELQYTQIKPKIIVELLNDQIDNLDYKIYCFNGKPQVILACTRESEIKLNFFDLKWNELMLGKKELRKTTPIKQPRYLKDMIGISKKLAKDFPFVRISFYEVPGKTMVGEMIFTPSACLADYYSLEGNKYLSNLLKI